MKYILFVAAFVVLGFTISSPVWACSYGEPSLWVTAWPIPTSGWDDGREAVPASTDTQIWFAVTHLGSPWHFSLLDPAGEELTLEVEKLTGLDAELTTWVTVQPVELLRPYTTYTAVLNIAETNTTWTFVTGAGPLEASLPEVKNLRYFIVDTANGGSDCPEVNWDREYVAIIDEPLVEQPYLYEMELHFEGEPGVVAGKSISYDWGTDLRPYGTVTTYTLGVDPSFYPCMTLHITDVAGHTVSSETTCKPDGCTNQWPQIEWDEDHENQLASWEDWYQQWDQLSHPCEGQFNAEGESTDESWGCATVPSSAPQSGWWVLVLLGIALAPVVRSVAH